MSFQLIINQTKHEKIFSVFVYQLQKKTFKTVWSNIWFIGQTE